MKVRKQTKDGDYCFGHGDLDFYENQPEGVAQNVVTRLQLLRGTWFIDLLEGTPWYQEILGKHDAVEVILRTRILETPGVLNIERFDTALDPNTRRLTITGVINTQYGQANLTEVLP